MPKTGLNPPTFGSFNIKVQVHRMQLVMMRIPATDGNTCKKIPLSWDNNESVSQNYSKQGSSTGYRRPPSKKLKIIISLITLGDRRSPNAPQKLPIRILTLFLNLKL